MEQTGCSESLAYKIQMPGNHPKESMQHSGHGESLKSRRCDLLFVGYSPHTDAVHFGNLCDQSFPNFRWLTYYFCCL